MSVSMVGTVNSVCSRLLQEYAVDAGLSPALQVIAEDEQLRIFQLATDAVFAEFIRGSSLSPAGWDTTAKPTSGAPTPTGARSSGTSRMPPAATGSSRGADALRCGVLAGLQQVLGPAGLDDRASWSNQLLQGLMSFRGMAAEIVETGKTPPKNLSPPSLCWSLFCPTRRRRRLLGVSGSRRPGSQMQGPTAAGELHFRNRNGPGANPAFQTELREFTELVFACAAACLDRFAEFKREYGLIDFADQETLVWNCWRTTRNFRLHHRTDQLHGGGRVPDTSPLQLQLFTKFAELVDKVVWVGDSKQAIYDFRGTDRELMKAVAAHIEQKTQAYTLLAVQTRGD